MKPTTGGMIRVVPLDLPFISLDFPRDIKVNSFINIRVRTYDFKESLTIVLQFISDNNTETREIHITSSDLFFETKFLKSKGSYIINIASNNAYLISKQVLEVYD